MIDIDKMDRIVREARRVAPCDMNSGFTDGEQELLWNIVNLQSLIAELRAARVVVDMFEKAYDVDAIKDWFDDNDDAGVEALAGYRAVVGPRKI